MHFPSSLQRILAQAALVAHLSMGVAFQFVTTNSLPGDALSPGCVAALTRDLTACPQQISNFATSSYFPAESLEEACTPACAADLSRYSSDTANSCGPGDTYDISETRKAPVSFVPTLLYYYYNKTCITDAGRWCNNVAHVISNQTMGVMSVDMALTNGSESGGRIRGRQQSVDSCDDCLIKAYQFQAGSPINGGYALQSNYSSLTASCSKTGFPLASSTTPFPGPSTTSNPPSPSCTGNKYTIQPGDTCRTISASQGVGTAWLLSDNRLEAFCGNFPTNGELCIQHSCRTAVVGQNDTCLSIAKAHGLSQVQVYTWNPILGDLCRHISKSVGDSICVSPPGDAEFATSTTQPSTTSMPSATAVPVPADKANGTTDRCSQYYLVQPGDYCNLLVLKFSISLPDFQFLNQGVNSNCTNLFAEESYCVAPVGRIDQYPGHPDYIPPEQTISDLPYDNLPKATFKAPAFTGGPVAAPLAPGTRKDCYIFANGANLELDMDLYPSFKSACEALAKGWGIRLDQLENWNPSLDTDASDCAPKKDLRYCMAAYDGGSVTQTPAPEQTSSQYPIREGAIATCVEFQTVRAPMTCQSVLDANRITIAQFFEWNPSVKADCSGMWLDYRYCVSIDTVPTDPVTTEPPPPSTTSSTQQPPTSTNGGNSPPGPTQPGTVSNCNKWHVVKTGDGCWSISQEYKITLDQFYEWNPAVSKDCGTNFWLDYAYCVGVQG